MTPQAQGGLHGLATALLRYGRARIELLQHELGQEQSRLLGMLARASAFIVGLMLCLQLACVVVLIAFWQTPWRLHAAVALLLLFIVATMLAWGAMRRPRQPPHAAFSASIDAFDKDRTMFESKPDAAPSTLDSALTRPRDAVATMQRDRPASPTDAHQPTGAS